MAIAAFAAEFRCFLCLSPSAGVLEGALLEVLRLRRFRFGFIDSLLVACNGATKVSCAAVPPSDVFTKVESESACETVTSVLSEDLATIGVVLRFCRTTGTAGRWAGLSTGRAEITTGVALDVPSGGLPCTVVLSEATIS